MDNLARSRAVVEALAARSPEFRASKAGWWVPRHRYFNEAHNAWYPCGNPGMWESMGVKTESLIGCHPPDLLAREHLADLWDVCREIAVKGRVSLHFHAQNKPKKRLYADVCTGDIEYGEAWAATESEALMAAAEAALGIA